MVQALQYTKLAEGLTRKTVSGQGRYTAVERLEAQFVEHNADDVYGDVTPLSWRITSPCGAYMCDEAHGTKEINAEENLQVIDQPVSTRKWNSGLQEVRQCEPGSRSTFMTLLEHILIEL